jgi:hypothetical protein
MQRLSPRSGRALLGVIAAALGLIVLSACSNEEPAASTAVTDTSLAPVTTVAAAADTTRPRGGTNRSTSTSIREPIEISYDIRHREPSDGGDRLVVLIEPGDYTEIDLSNLVLDIIEANEPVAQLDVVDSQRALPAVIRNPANLTPQQSRHYVLRLEDGTRVVFLGPYSDLGSFIIGS